MLKLNKSIDHVRLLDEFARQNSVIHRLHPLIKLVTTGIYLIVVISFDRYAVSGLLSLMFFPLILLIMSGLPAASIFRRVLLAEPLIIGIGLLNPLFDRHYVNLGGSIISSGWLTLASICIKSSLIVTACLILISTTNIEKLAVAMRMMRIPQLFVLQILLTYRYLTVLFEEAYRMLRAYTLRAPLSKGLKSEVWGSFIGQLIIRTFERAQRVYQAMTLRGFPGEYFSSSLERFSRYDLTFFAVCSIYFVLCRVYNIPTIIGIKLLGAFFK